MFMIMKAESINSSLHVLPQTVHCMYICTHISKYIILLNKKCVRTKNQEHKHRLGNSKNVSYRTASLIPKTNSPPFNCKTTAHNTMFLVPLNCSTSKTKFYDLAIHRGKRHLLRQNDNNKEMCANEIPGRK